MNNMEREEAVRKLLGRKRNAQNGMLWLEGAVYEDTHRRLADEIAADHARSVASVWLVAVLSAAIGAAIMIGLGALAIVLLT
jgi:hypothetical protein